MLLAAAASAFAAALIPARLHAGLGTVVVLVLVDGPADVVLPLVHLTSLLRGQAATVRGAVGRNLVMDARLTTLQVARLARGQLAGADSLSDPLLLVVRTLAGPRKRRVLRMPAVHRNQIAAVIRRHLEMVLLRHRGLEVLLMFPALLIARRTRL